ncbi:hypothetical protein MUP37_03860 [Candidatus Bathyarchaeota archaeon]|nr:hypothetical protein [Candidatus Bathyarchaeota archaeon]
MTVVLVELERTCENCSACNIHPMTNGFYCCRRYNVVVTLNDSCDTIDLLESTPIRRRTRERTDYPMFYPSDLSFCRIPDLSK